MLELYRKGGNEAIFKEIDSLKKKELNLEKNNTKKDEENVNLKIKFEGTYVQRKNIIKNTTECFKKMHLKEIKLKNAIF